MGKKNLMWNNWKTLWIYALNFKWIFFNFFQIEIILFSIISFCVMCSAQLPEMKRKKEITFYYPRKVIQMLNFSCNTINNFTILLHAPTLDLKTNWLQIIFRFRNLRIQMMILLLRTEFPFPSIEIIFSMTIIIIIKKKN